MAVRVVEQFEVIGVNHSDSKRFGVATGAAKLDRKPFVHITSVE